MYHHVYSVTWNKLLINLRSTTVDCSLSVFVETTSASTFIEYIARQASQQVYQDVTLMPLTRVKQLSTPWMTWEAIIPGQYCGGSLFQGCLALSVAVYGLGYYYHWVVKYWWLHCNTILFKWDEYYNTGCMHTLILCIITAITQLHTYKQPQH